MEGAGNELNFKNNNCIYKELHRTVLVKEGFSEKALKLKSE